MNAQKLKLMRARLSVLNEGDSLWDGITTYVREMVEDTVDASSRAGLTADDRAFNDGRQSMGRDLLQALESEWRIAHNPPDGKS